MAATPQERIAAPHVREKECSTLKPAHAHGLNKSGGSAWLGSLDPLRSALLRVTRGSRTQPAPPEGRDRVASTIMPEQPRIFSPRPQPVIVLVVGCGMMGCNIAGELLRRGCQIFMYDESKEARERAKVSLSSTLRGHVDAGMLLAPDVEKLLARCQVIDSLDQAAGTVNVVFEAVSEQLQAKKAVLSAIASACTRMRRPYSEVAICTNTVLIPIEHLTTDLSDEWATRVLGVRFLFPCWFVDDVELTMGAVRATTSIRRLHPTNNAFHSTEQLLRSMRFRTTRYKNGSERWLLSEEEVELYKNRQRQQCARDATHSPQDEILLPTGLPTA
jgi:hypothetical protein